MDPAKPYIFLSHNVYYEPKAMTMDSSVEMRYATLL
jgi:hypothetical protein